jgi:cytochrome c oxidase assembly protein subunit 15
MQEMTTSYTPGVHRYAIFLSVCTFILLIAGALVTSNEAALSVPDWPLSYGSLTPPMVGGIRYEHTHRVIAALVGLFTIGLAVLLWRKDQRKWVRYLGLAAIGAVIAQGVLGGLTVLLYLHYGMPVAHACLAQIFFGTVVSIAVFTSRWWASDLPQVEDHGSPSIHTLATLNAVVIFLQVVLGAGFRHRDIPVWPHAAGALVVLATITWTAVALRKRFESSREMSKARIALHAIFGLQFLLGIGAWWSRLTTADAPQPMPVMVTLTVVHTVVGALLFALSIVVVLLCYRLVPRRKEVAASVPSQVAVR